MADPRTTDVFADLHATALVGTDRRPARTIGLPGPLGATLAAVPTDDPAGALLDAAALATVYGRAGTMPATGVALPEPAPTEALSEAPPAAGQRLYGLMFCPDAPLVSEWLELAEAHRRRVPHWILPRLLDWGRHDPAVREPMLAVGGARIRWLAAQNRDWRYLSRVTADGAADRIGDGDWEFGDAGRRLDYLRALRAVDPAAARGKLAADWGSEEPAQRAALLATFTVGLSADDEEFLEAALDDRRKEVRGTAMETLVRLPGSAYAQRMSARAAACLTLQGRELRVTPPAPPDEVARRDGLGGDAGSDDGSGAVRLERVLHATSLAAFRAIGGSLTDLLSAADGHDRELLAGGVAMAARREIEVDPEATRQTVRELLSGRREWFHMMADTLLELLPADERGGLVIDRLGSRPIGDSRSYRMVSACPRPWPAELGRVVLAALAKQASAPMHLVSDWVCLLGERLPVELLPEAKKLADTHDTLGRLAHLAVLRQRMHKEFL